VVKVQYGLVVIKGEKMPIINKDGLIISEQEWCPACRYPRDEFDVYSISHTKQSFYIKAGKDAESGFYYTFTCKRCSYAWNEYSDDLKEKK